MTSLYDFSIGEIDELDPNGPFARMKRMLQPPPPPAPPPIADPVTEMEQFEVAQQWQPAPLNAPEPTADAFATASAAPFVGELPPPSPAADVAVAPTLEPPGYEPVRPNYVSPAIAEPYSGPIEPLPLPNVNPPPTSSGGGLFDTLQNFAGDAAGFVGQGLMNTANAVGFNPPTPSGFQPPQQSILEPLVTSSPALEQLQNDLGNAATQLAEPLDLLPGATFTGPNGEVFGTPYSETVGGAVRMAVPTTPIEVAAIPFTGFLPGVDDAARAGIRGLSRLGRVGGDDLLTQGFRAGIGPGDDLERQLQASIDALDADPDLARQVFAAQGREAGAEIAARQGQTSAEIAAARRAARQQVPNAATPGAVEPPTVTPSEGLTGATPAAPDVPGGAGGPSAGVVPAAGPPPAPQSIEEAQDLLAGVGNERSVNFGPQFSPAPTRPLFDEAEQMGPLFGSPGAQGQMRFGPDFPSLNEQALSREAQKTYEFLNRPNPGVPTQELPPAEMNLLGEGQTPLGPPQAGRFGSDVPPPNAPPARDFSQPPPPKPPEMGRWWNEVQDVLGAPLTLKSVVSPPLLRQGLVRLVTHPIEAAKDLGVSLNAARSERIGRRVQDSIMSDMWVSPNRVNVPGFEGGRVSPMSAVANGLPPGEGFTWTEVGGHLRDWGPNVEREARDPVFQGLARRQTRAGDVLQTLAGPSERQTAIELNLNATKWYKDEASKMWAQGNRNRDDYIRLRKHIEHFMQWGELGQHEIPFFFSLRAISGRAQALSDMAFALARPGRALRPGAEREALKSLVSLVGANMALIGAASRVPGVDIEWNPLPTIHVGRKYHFDPWAGWNQQARVVYGIGNALDKGGATQDVAQNVAGAVGDYGRSGLAPTIGKGIDIGTGKDWRGRRYDIMEDIRSGGIAADLLAPFNVEGIVEAYREGGLGGAALTAIPSTFSMSTSSYKDYGGMLDDLTKTLPTNQRTDINGKVVTKWSELSPAQQNAAKEANVRIRETSAAQDAEQLAGGSPYEQINQDVAQQRSEAFTQFQQDANGDAYRSALSDSSREASIRFRQESQGQDFEAQGADRKLMDAYYREVVDAAGRDYDLQDRLDTQFRARLSPAAAEALEANLQTSSDPNYAKLKAARDYLDRAVWQERDSAYITLADSAVPDAIIKQYPTYNDLAKAAQDRTQPNVANLRSLKGSVDAKLTQAVDRARYQDPQADALMYIYGYRDNVVSERAQQLVMQWGQQNGVNFSTPPFKK